VTRACATVFGTVAQAFRPETFSIAGTVAIDSLNNFNWLPRRRKSSSLKG